ncbi:hypothetical protein DFQ30_003255 [Apophysomyces sp. BC1015]|nr:hypothetical protein DFQ30_003255 [Apophysomyces sp. BC1015]
MPERIKEVLKNKGGSTRWYGLKLVRLGLELLDFADQLGCFLTLEKVDETLILELVRIAVRQKRQVLRIDAQERNTRQSSGMDSVPDL